MSTKLVEAADLSKLHQIGEFGLNELAAMKEAIAKKLTIPQFNLFMYQMNRMGLDPSLGHGVPILYGSDVNIRVEYEGRKHLAQKSDGYLGVHNQVVCEGEEFEAETNDEGIITKISHKVKFPRGKVVGAYSVAKRDGFPNLIVLCDSAEFDKYAKKNPSFWRLENGSLDPDMCKKHVGTRAVNGQYDIATVVEETMSEASAMLSETYVRKEINPDADPAPEEKPTTKPAGKSKAADSKVIDVESTPVDEAAERKALNRTIREKAALLGFKTDEEVGKHMASIVQPEPGQKLTIEQLKIVVAAIENAIADLGDKLPD